MPKHACVRAAQPAPRRLTRKAAFAFGATLAIAGCDREALPFPSGDAASPPDASSADLAPDGAPQADLAPPPDLAPPADADLAIGWQPLYGAPIPPDGSE
jgi:hypothetical protein